MVWGFYGRQIELNQGSDILKRSPIINANAIANLTNKGIIAQGFNELFQGLFPEKCSMQK